MESRFYSVRRHCSPAWPWRQKAQAQICGQYWRSTRLFVRLLRLCAVRLRALWLLRAGVLLQRHLPGHGPMGRMGLQPRLGRPSLCERRRRKLPRRTRSRVLSQQRWPSPRQRVRGSSHSSGARPSAGHAAVARNNAPARIARPQLPVRTASHASAPRARLRTQLQVAVVSSVAVAVAAADMKAAARTALTCSCWIRTAVCTTSGGAYRLRRFSLLRHFRPRGAQMSAAGRVARRLHARRKS